MSRPDFFSMTCQRRFGAPENWQWCEVNASPEVAPEGMTRVVGSVTTVYKSGPRAGKAKWKPRHECDVFFVPHAVVEEVESEWEQETGKCRKCGGSGAEWAGWSKANGTKHKPCSRCGATGKRPEDAA